MSRVLFEGKRSLFPSFHVCQSLAFSKNQQIALKTNHYWGAAEKNKAGGKTDPRVFVKLCPPLFLAWRQWHTQKVIRDDFQLRGRRDHLRNKEVDTIVSKSSISPLASFLLFLPRSSTGCQIFVSDCSRRPSDLGQGLAGCL